MRSIFFLIGLIGFAIGCQRTVTVPEKVIQVKDVTQPQIFDLTETNGNMLEVSYAHFHFQGSLDGNAYFVTESWATQSVSGIVDTNLGESVFSQRYLLTYVPDGVRTEVLPSGTTFANEQVIRDGLGILTCSPTLFSLQRMSIAVDSAQQAVVVRMRS